MMIASNALFTIIATKFSSRVTNVWKRLSASILDGKKWQNLACSIGRADWDELFVMSSI